MYDSYALVFVSEIPGQNRQKFRKRGLADLRNIYVEWKPFPTVELYRIISTISMCSGGLTRQYISCYILLILVLFSIEP